MNSMDEAIGLRPTGVPRVSRAGVAKILVVLLSSLLIIVVLVAILSFMSGNGVFAGDSSGRNENDGSSGEGLPAEQAVEAESAMVAFERAVVQSESARLIDSSVSGEVAQLLITEGQRVEQGDVIALVSNPQFTLATLAQEVSVSEQLTALKSEESRLQQRRSDLEIRLLNEEYLRDLAQSRYRMLVAVEPVGAATLSDLHELELEIAYRDKLIDQLKGQLSRHRDHMREVLTYVESLNPTLRQHLTITDKLKSSLTILSPTNGLVTSVSVKEGEYIQTGGRIGRIDPGEDLGLVVKVDEYYLKHLNGPPHVITRAFGEPMVLNIKSVVKSVENGKFVILLNAPHTAEAVKLNAGQTIPVEVHFSPGESGYNND